MKAVADQGGGGLWCGGLAERSGPLLLHVRPASPSDLIGGRHQEDQPRHPPARGGAERRGGSLVDAATAETGMAEISAKFRAGGGVVEVQAVRALEPLSNPSDGLCRIR